MGRAEGARGRLAPLSTGAFASIAVAAALAVAAGCATEESITFTDKDCAGYGCISGAGSSSSSSSGIACTPDDMCAVSWATDIYAKIIDGPPGCTNGKSCHGGGNAPGSLTLETGKPHAAYTALTGYQLDDVPGPAGPYIVPCDKDASKLLCNVVIEGATNSFGKCGTLMPQTFDGQLKLTQAEVDQIAEWIECGAPEN